MKPIRLKQIALWCSGTMDPEFDDVIVEGFATDSREAKPGQLFVPLVGARADGHNFIRRAWENGAVAALSAVDQDIPGFPIIRVEDTLTAFGAIAAGYRASMEVKVIGITGSVGKTTTKEMLAAILRKKYRTVWTEGNHNNHLGVPMSVMDIEEDTEVAALELGMNHFGEMSYLTKIAQPDVAIFTNIGTMHIEHLGSRVGILKAKMEILEGLKPNGTVIMNGDEPLLWDLKGTLGFRQYYFGIENPACDVCAADICSTDDGVRFRVAAFGKDLNVFVPASGQHSVYNALAAITEALLAGVEPEAIVEGLASFENTGMRQNIYEKNGYTIINDCYNAGPESMQAAIRVLAERSTKGRRIAVLGDMLELGGAAIAEHYRVGRLAADCGIDMIFAFGANAVRVATGATTGGMRANAALCYDDQDQLIHDLRLKARKGDTLLFKGSRGMKMERVLNLFLQEDLPD